MKKFIALIVVLIGICAIAKAQALDPTDPHWCTYCRPVEKQNIAQRINANTVPPLTGDPTGRNSKSADQSFRFPSSDATLYVLKARFLVNNDSDKRIKRVTWEYTISNLETKALIQTSTFVTEKNIAPRKSAVLKEKVEISRVKLAGGTVPVAQAGQKPDKIAVNETYQIKEILYKDGTVRKP